MDVALFIGSTAYLGVIYIAIKIHTRSKSITIDELRANWPSSIAWALVVLLPVAFCGLLFSGERGSRASSDARAGVWVGLAVASVIASAIIYLFVERQKEEEGRILAEATEAAYERERERLVRERKGLEHRFELFSATDDYQYVRQFAKKYGRRFDRKSVNQLRQVISTNWDFSIEELQELLNVELYEIDIDLLATRLETSNDKSRDGLIRSFLSSYNGDDASSIALLHMYFDQKGIAENDVDSMRSHVSRVQAEMEAERFKKQLLDERSVDSTDLDALTGYEFEDFLKELFTKMGYQVEQTRLSGDQGADLVVLKLGEKTVIQAKRFISAVGNKAVQEIVAAMSLYEAHKGMVITNSRFTPAAYELAKANNIQLVDGSALSELIRHYW